MNDGQCNGNISPNKVGNFQGKFSKWLHVLGLSLAQLRALDTLVRSATITPGKYQWFVEIRRVSSTSTLETLRFYLKDIFISFGILLLFRYVPIVDALNLLKGRVYEENTRPFHHVLTTLLCYSRQFYENLTEWLWNFRYHR
jgi:hypothetical protein